MRPGMCRQSILLVPKRLQAAQASGGDALVWGHSVRGPSGLSAARAITGVCPQFDVLWPQMPSLILACLWPEPSLSRALCLVFCGYNY
eukprot:1145582-Pelagomonas_calceolata.AAC.6